jgi:methylmalonyl-CoA mutase N-terminal domain/subunit
MVGVNGYTQAENGRGVPLLRVDEEVQRRQCENLARVKAGRSAVDLERALGEVRRAAKDGGNLMAPIVAAARVYATEQEICDVLRDVLGTYTDPAEF